ncbi:MAG: hypothetical protein AMXMBFR47_04240 [Planctomycetota bacterium]
MWFIRYPLILSLFLAVLLAGCPSTPGTDTNTNANTNSTGGDPGDGSDGGSTGDPDPPGSGDSRVTVDAGPDQTVVAQSLVTLAGSGSVRGSNAGLTLKWEQLDGPTVALSDDSIASPTFIAPSVVTATTLLFRLTISKSDLANWDDVAITVTPIGPELPAPPADAGQVAAAWKNGASDSRVVVTWQLPTGTSDGLTADPAGATGQALGTLANNQIASGVHRLIFEFSGSGPADVSFGVTILGFEYRVSERLAAPLRREIAIEVLTGSARVLFNGWLPAGDPDAGGPTGTVIAETQVAWRNGTEPVNADIRFATPLTTLPTSSEGAALQGFERASFPQGVALGNGAYWLTFEMADAGRSADVTYFASFPGFSTRVDRRITGPERRLIGLDVFSGTARVFFDGWKQAGESGAGGVTGVHPVEVVGAWRDASANVSVALDLYVNGVRTPYSTQAFALQGCQRVYLPSGSTVADGEYRIGCALSGLNRTADVTLDAAILNYTLSRSARLVGDSVTHTIVVQVTGGVATEISNTWTP